MARDTYKFHFMVGNNIIRSGITNDMDGQEKHLKNTLGEHGYIKQVGRATTKDAALTWEAKAAESGLPTRRNVIKLIDITEKTKHWSPEDMFEYYLKKMRTGDLSIQPNKALVIFLDDTGNKYDIKKCMAGLYFSEAIGLMEVAKIEMLKGMGYLSDPE